MSNAGTLHSGEVTSKQMSLVILASTLGTAVERKAVTLLSIDMEFAPLAAKRRKS